MIAAIHNVANDNRATVAAAAGIGFGVPGRLLLVGPMLGRVRDHGPFVTLRAARPSSGKSPAVTGGRGNLRPVSPATAAAVLALYAALPAHRGSIVDRIA